jgi:hypothetical protein
LALIYSIGLKWIERYDHASIMGITLWYLCQVFFKAKSTSRNKLKESKKRAVRLKNEPPKNRKRRKESLYLKSVYHLWADIVKIKVLHGGIFVVGEICDPMVINS